MDTTINEAIEQEDIELVRAILESDDECQVKFCDADSIDSLDQDTYLVACRVGNVNIYEMLATYWNDRYGRNGHLREYEQNDGTVLIRTTHCSRRMNIDHLCRLNFDQGLGLSF